jgi:hypothetical protein
MSYQPLPSQPLPGQAVPGSIEPPRRRGSALIWLGALVILGGIGAAIGLFFAGQQRFDTRVERLAQDAGALSGCVTDLRFTKDGTFVLYYVSRGTVRLNGANDGCADTETVRVSADAEPPEMVITLTDADGEDVRIVRTDLDTETTLEAGGVVARPYRAVDINETGNYEIDITADADADRFAIGLGPKIEEPSAVTALLIGALAAALGALLIIIGSVRRRLPSQAPRGTAVGVGYPGPGGYQAQPPYQGAPGSASLPGGPPYQQPPAGAGQYPQQPPVVYQPPGQQGFDHPTQAMPPIVRAPDPVGPFGTAPGGSPEERSIWAAPPPPPPPDAGTPSAGTPRPARADDDPDAR